MREGVPVNISANAEGLGGKTPSGDAVTSATPFHAQDLRCMSMHKICTRCNRLP